jgi:hypothetical protein
LKTAKPSLVIDLLCVFIIARDCLLFPINSTYFLNPNNTKDMAATNLRIGLEQEFFGLSLTYRESRTNEFWKIPDGVQAETTMTQQRPILVPADPNIGPYYAPASDPPRVLWESNWGFRAVGDSYGMAAVLGQDVGSCQ